MNLTYIIVGEVNYTTPAPLFWNKAKRKAYVYEAKLQYKIETYEVDTIEGYFGFPRGDKFLVFFSDKKQLMLDKNHKLYLKTFKAINRLNEYVKKEHDITLFDDLLNIDR